MTSKSLRTSAFTLIEIMIVVAIIGLLAAIAIPNWVRARSNSQTSACINNLRQIDGAKQDWALENKAAPSAIPVLTDIQPYLGRGVNPTNQPTCPTDSVRTFSSSYVMGNLATTPACQISSNSHVLH